MKVVRTGRAERLLRKLDPPLRRDALATLAAFDADSAARGLHFEKLHGFRTLYSIRIDRNHRIILRRTEAPDTFEIEDIGPHDVYRRLDDGDD